jgi:hypothetical protein
MLRKGSPQFCCKSPSLPSLDLRNIQFASIRDRLANACRSDIAGCFLSGPASHAAPAAVASGHGQTTSMRHEAPNHDMSLVAFVGRSLRERSDSTSLALTSSWRQVGRHSFRSQLINLCLQLVSPVDKLATQRLHLRKLICSGGFQCCLFDLFGDEYESKYFD